MQENYNDGRGFFMKKQASGSRNVLVVINPHSGDYSDYIRYIKPYLNNFGVPCREVDATGLTDMSVFGDCALILIAHRGALTCKARGEAVKAMEESVKNGTGLVSFDASVFCINGGSFGAAANGSVSIADQFSIPSNSHYIVSLHDKGESISLFEKITVEDTSRLSGSEVLVYAGETALLEAGTFGEGKVVKWNSCEWASHRVKGPVFGLDDLVWRSLVWAARKPFVLQGMPPFMTMRVDDVWGSARSGMKEDPLYWVGICNKYGLKPWLGLFINNMTPVSIDSVKRYVADGGATVFPHAFAGYEKSVDGTLVIEDWIYFNHRERKDYCDDTMKLNAMRVEHWHNTTGLPISKVALGHYYETGTNALQYLLKWGCEYIGTHMNPGLPFQSECQEKAHWVKGGPYRLYETEYYRAGTRPVYYADYFKAEGCPGYNGQLFNCVIEIRDDKGYEWAPNNNVEDTIAHGVKQIRRSFDSMVLASLFTHESDYIQNITPENWEKIIRGVCEGIAAYKPIYVTTDDACRYVRAIYNMKIDTAAVVDGMVSLVLSGDNDMPTKCYLFTEDNGTIESRLVDVPQVNGKAKTSIVL